MKLVTPLKNESTSLLRSRLKIYLPLKYSETIYLQGSFAYIDFVFCEINSMSGCKLTLDIIYLSTRYPFMFFHRSKYTSLDIIIKYLISMFQNNNKNIYRVLVDKNSKLAR